MKLIENKGEIRYLQLDKSFKIYDILDEMETPDLMQYVARNRWKFPMTLYFEAYGETEEILGTALPVQQVPSKKRIITLSLKSARREELSAFTVQIEDEVALKEAFAEFFYVAEQNHFFALANEACITYEGEIPTVYTQNAEILLADYDGQGAFLITNNFSTLYFAFIVQENKIKQKSRGHH